MHQHIRVQISPLSTSRCIWCKLNICHAATSHASVAVSAREEEHRFRTETQRCQSDTSRRPYMSCWLLWIGPTASKPIMLTEQHNNSSLYSSLICKQYVKQNTACSSKYNPSDISELCTWDNWMLHATMENKQSTSHQITSWHQVAKEVCSSAW